jgi:hypothetical protein
MDQTVWRDATDVLLRTADDGLGNTVISFGGNSVTLYVVLKSQLVRTTSSSCERT